MKTRFVSVLVLALAMMFTLAADPALARTTGGMRSVKAVALEEALRDLWGDHIFWVRSVVVSAKYGDAEAMKVAEGNAVKNARAIADSVVPFYGKAAADKLFGLLAGHYGAVKGYMTAAYGNDKAGMETSRNDLVANAGEIAAFLSSANPNWPKDVLNGLLMAHGAHHLVQIEAFARGDFASEAENWATMKGHMNVIADALAVGIVKQFPRKF